jgi:phosphinothricin acetyltransferase
MGKYTIRSVRDEDAEEILRLYEPYIQETAISFEYETPSIEEFRNRIHEISSDYPYIVCLQNDKIIGYAYAHRQLERAAYQWNAELTIYIDNSKLRCGVGKILYSALIEILKLQNIQNIYGCVTASNENSVKLHEYFGFHKSGTFYNTGYKCGVWHDVVWFEKNIGSYDGEPKPLLPVTELDQNVILEIYKKHCKLLQSR